MSNRPCDGLWFLAEPEICRRRDLSRGRSAALAIGAIVLAYWPLNAAAAEAPSNERRNAQKSDDDSAGSQFLKQLDLEPVRRKTKSPVRFGDSFVKAQDLARRTGRRMLVVFTGEGCWWCRVLEKRTFNDAEVAELSHKYVCVEVYKNEEHARLWDEFQIDAMPRSFVLTAEGKCVDRLDGYAAATEYAAWMKAGLDKEPQADDERPPAPRAAGASVEEADLKIWFVASRDETEQWKDASWITHAALIELLKQAGLQPRIEHLSERDLPDRWEQAVQSAKLPDMVASKHLGGTLKSLDEARRLRIVASDRLESDPEWAAPLQLWRRFVWLVPGSIHESQALRAARVLLKPASGKLLEKGSLGAPVDPAGAEHAVQEAAIAYLSADPQRLAPVLSRQSLLRQYTRRPGKQSWLDGMQATVSEVELRGNDWFAVAVLQAEFENNRSLGQTPLSVVLMREDSQWRVLSVLRDSRAIDAVRHFANLPLEAKADSEPPQPAKLLTPADGDELTSKGLEWEQPAEGKTPLAQVCELVIVGHGSDGWPDFCDLSFHAGTQSNGAVKVGVSGEQCHWRVWSIGKAGIAVSESRMYRWPMLNP